LTIYVANLENKSNPIVDSTIIPSNNTYSNYALHELNYYFIALLNFFHYDRFHNYVLNSNRWYRPLYVETNSAEIYCKIMYLL